MKQAFTLVELIVAIIILSILGAIAFITFQGYSIEARDTKRISDTKNLLNKVNVEVANGTKFSDLIIIEKPNKLTINGISNRTGYQGKVNFNNLKENGKDFKDPNDINQDYPIAYALGGRGTGAYEFTQIATISEKENRNILLGDYFKIQYGDSPSLFTHENKDGTNIDSDYITEEEGNNLIYGSEGGNNSVPQPSIIKSVADCTATGEIIKDTGVKFKNTEVAGGQTCDTDDIIVCSGVGTGYQIAACNVGAKYAGSWDDCISPNATSTTESNCHPDRMGYHFQWGNNYGFSMLTSPTTSDSKVAGTRPFSDSTFITLNPWSSSNNKDLWGGITGTNEAKQGPCADGYHVPSNTEWKGILDSFPISDRMTFSTVLKLPFAGFRLDGSSYLVDQVSNGYYWSSTWRLSDTAHAMFFYNAGNIYPEKALYLSNGCSVRCIKN